MHIRFSLNLPRDAVSVPVVRRISGEALRSLGVAGDCVDDIELALTEACTNVLKHATGASDDYEVTFEVDESACNIRVIDAGEGFDEDALPPSPAHHSAESGRGLYLMQALVDELSFVSKPEVGTVVHLEKALHLTTNALLGRLAGRSTAG
ncbi:MAG: ATP-binding protein [Actinomycetota bacterium]